MKVNIANFSFTSPRFKLLIVAISAIILLIVTANTLASKEVTLTIDGQSRRIITKAGKVSDLLKEKKIKVSSHDQVKPTSDSLLFSGAKVRVRHAKRVVLDVNGKRRKVWVVAGKVGRAVEELGIDTSADIRLHPKSGAKIASGMTIKVKLLNRWIEKIQTDVAFGTKRQDDSSLAKGSTRVAQAGKLGIKETVIEHVMAGRQEIEKIVRSDKIVAAPVDELVKVGTRVPRATVASAPPAPSRGGRSMVMAASAYAAYTGGAGGRTATGTGVYKGIVAVDPRVIPLGTKLYIDGYGSAIAADTGGAIKGNRIDLGFATAGEAYQFGRQTVNVRVLD